MMNGKDALISDLFVVKHHCDFEKDRAIIQDVMDWIEKDVESMRYEPKYPECYFLSNHTDETPSTWAPPRKHNVMHP